VDHVIALTLIGKCNTPPHNVSLVASFLSFLPTSTSGIRYLRCLPILPVKQVSFPLAESKQRSQILSNLVQKACQKRSNLTSLTRRERGIVIDSFAVLVKTAKNSFSNSPFRSNRLSCRVNTFRMTSSSLPGTHAVSAWHPGALGTLRTSLKLRQSDHSHQSTEPSKLCWLQWFRKAVCRHFRGRSPIRSSCNASIPRDISTGNERSESDRLLPRSVGGISVIERRYRSALRFVHPSLRSQ